MVCGYMSRELGRVRSTNTVDNNAVDLRRADASFTHVRPRPPAADSRRQTPAIGQSSSSRPDLVPRCRPQEPCSGAMKSSAWGNLPRCSIGSNECFAVEPGSPRTIGAVAKLTCKPCRVTDDFPLLSISSCCRWAGRRARRWSCKAAPPAWADSERCGSRRRGRPSRPANFSRTARS